MSNDSLLDNEKISLAEFRQYMFYPIYPIKDLVDLNGRPMAESFPYWRRNGLMPFIQKGTWNIEISFAQVIWLRMLDHLRNLGYSIKDTATLCDRLFKDAYHDELPKKKLKYHYDRLKRIELAGTLSLEEKELMQRIDQMLKDSLLLYSLKFEFNFLTELIMWCIDRNEDAGLLIFPGGKVIKKQGADLFAMSESVTDITAPHIYISIYYFLKEFIQSEDLKIIHVPGLLTENEKKVLIALNEKNVQELIIKLSNGNIERIDSKSMETFGGERAKEIRLAIGLGQYEEVTLSTRDSGSLSFKKIKKQILPGRTGKY
jgi:DNA-binding transcriptional MerR regulator